jgi:outer membrane lipoprotein carrier protein
MLFSQFCFRVAPLLLASLLPAQTNPFHANSSANDQSLRVVEARYQKAATLEVTFLERYLDNGKQVNLEAGKAYFQHPGRMRWEYEAPEKNVFLVDGKFVWFYAPADHTVTRMPARNSEDWRTPLAFLTTGMKLSHICAALDLVADQQPSQPGNTMYRCTLRPVQQQIASPASKESSDSVLFEISPSRELARIRIHQEGGIDIEFTFKDWQWNPALPANLFQFSAPKGVAIVDGVLPDAPGMRP